MKKKKLNQFSNWLNIKPFVQNKTLFMCEKTSKFQNMFRRSQHRIDIQMNGIENQLNKEEKTHTTLLLVMICMDIF